jgi:hypothetical protein
VTFLTDIVWQEQHQGDQMSLWKTRPKM